MSTPNPYVLTSSQPNSEELQTALGSSTLVGKTQISGGTPLALSQPAWFVDQSNLSGLASDTNNGLTAGTPLLTDAERQRRWGGVDPTLPSSLATCIITYLSGSPDGTDPILCSPRLFGTLLIMTMGTPPSRSTGALSGVVAKSIPTNQALNASLPAGTVAGDLVINSSRANSYAFAYKSLGGSLWQLTQPIAAIAAGTTTTAAPTQNNAWANADNVTIFRGAANGPSTPNQWNVNVCEFAPVQYAVGASFAQAPTLRDINVGSPFATDFGFDTAIIGGGVRMINVGFARRYFITPYTSAGWATALSGCLVQQGGNGGGPSAATLMLAGGNLNNGNSWPFEIALDCDFMMASTTGASFIDSTPIATIGTLYVDSGNVVPGGAATGFCYMSTTFNGAQPAIYGPGGVNPWTMLRYIGTAANSFPCAGGLKIRGSANAYGASTSGGVTSWRQIPLSAAALDAAAPGGFAGYAVWPSFGGFTNLTAPA